MATTAPAPSPIPIPMDLLEEIFLSLLTPADLARASAVCIPFRRAIADRAFRRRFRLLHPPPLLGFVVDRSVGFHPVQEPQASAPLALALAGAADFSYSFVPSPRPAEHPDICWRPRGVRDGRVLLEWISSSGREFRRLIRPDDGHSDPDVGVLIDRAFTVDHRALTADHLRWIMRRSDFHFAVCDPLSRRYVLLPPISEDLTPHSKHSLLEFETMLAPAGEGDEETSFKVICTAKYETNFAIFVFSSATGQWSVAESTPWPYLGVMHSLNLSSFLYARGCFYWKAQPWDWGRELHVLDTRSMVFSTISVFTGYHLQLRDLHLQSHEIMRSSAIAAGREGALAMFSLVCQDGSFAIHYTTLQNEAEEWQLENIIQLPAQYRDFSISTVGTAEGFLFFSGAPEDVPSQDVDYFSLDIETCKITKVCSNSKAGQFSSYNRAYPYFGFPPPLSDPTI